MKSIQFSLTLPEDELQMLQHTLANEISRTEIISRKLLRRTKVKDHPDVLQMKKDLTLLHSIRTKLKKTLENALVLT